MHQICSDTHTINWPACFAANHWSLSHCFWTVPSIVFAVLSVALLGVRYDRRSVDTNRTRPSPDVNEWYTPAVSGRSCDGMTCRYTVWNAGNPGDVESPLFGVASWSEGM